MSYFAILSDDPKSLEVCRCHVNLWVLDGLGRHVFYLDVGIGLKSNAKPKGLRLTLPVGVSADDFQDLRETTKANANAIFGEAARVDDHVITTVPRELEQEGRAQQGSSPPLAGPKTPETPTASVPQPEELSKREDDVTLQLSALRATRNPVDSSGDYSVWDLELMNWAPAAEIYVRGRFRITSLNRTWTPQISGAILDLRLCDVREAPDVANLGGLDAQIVPIKKLNLFANVPAAFKSRLMSPTPAHVRLLEGKAWSGYLNRQTKKLSRHKLMVYYWKSSDVLAKKPFRAFVDFAGERSVLGWRPYVFALLLVTLVWLARDLTVGQVFTFVTDRISGIWAIVAAGGLGAFVKYVIPFLRSATQNIDTVRRWYRSIEAWWFNNS